MPLLKAKALPVVIADIANSIHNASTNSATAIAFLYGLISLDPPGYDVDSIITRLSRDAFRLRQQCYPPKELATLAAKLTVSVGCDTAYWPVYTYLFALLPVLVERPRIANNRWTDEEYHKLEIACFSRWCNAHNDADDSLFMAGYTRMRAAAQSWFGRRMKVTAAHETSLISTVDEIEKSFPPQQGAVRGKAFRYAAEEFVGNLYSVFQANLTQYWMGARGLGFLASDRAPLPRHIDKESGWP